jgi:hypothetical protein
MLMQLVCTDRRYARMNCFNIREIQGILKRKFFTDLVNSHDHKNLLEKTMIGLRYKTNSNINLDLDMLSFYNFGLHTNFAGSSINYNNLSVSNNKTYSIMNYFSINTFKNNVFKLSYNLTTDLFSIPFFFNFNSLMITPTANFLFKSFYLNFFFINLNYNNFSKTKVVQQNKIENNNSFLLTNNNLFFKENKFGFTENTENQRFNRFNNILINYDYKTGHYIGN